LLAVALYKGESPQYLGDDAAGVVSGGDFGGNAGETTLLYGQGWPAPRLLLVGLGESELFTLEKLRRAAATVARRARTLGLHSAAFSLPVLPDTAIREIARTVAEGAKLGLYRFDRHKSAADDRDLETFWLVADEAALDEATEGAKLGARVAEGTALARDLANEPSNVATPEYLAQRARKISEKYGMELAVLDRACI
jgi:leucyl aminopeptidase